ncbi:HotDog domain-containing protein [Abortiporus biennis]|nr:HotDog domain-containing protein [Abortiporus biennis]
MSVDNKIILTPSVRNAPGNVSQETKDRLADIFDGFVTNEAFALAVSQRLEVTEMSITPKVEEPRKVEAKVVIEVDVTSDMINGNGTLHGGCTAYLVDFCTSIAISLHSGYLGNWRRHVSSTLSVTYHAPAALGSRIRIINTTVAMGARAMTARAEIYDATNKRLAATGTHVKMEPSGPKL